MYKILIVIYDHYIGFGVLSIFCFIMGQFPIAARGAGTMFAGKYIFFLFFLVPLLIRIMRYYRKMRM